MANMVKPAADSDDTERSLPDVLADLDSLTETQVEQDGKRFLTRLGAAPLPQALPYAPLASSCPPTVPQLADA